MKKVAIIIINYNREKDTVDCLESILAIESSKNILTTIVVDNGSKNKFATNKNYKEIGLKILRSEKNLGFAGGNNFGIKHALNNGADYVLLLNNDTFVDRKFIKELIDVFEEKKDAGIVAPKIYFAKGFEFHDRYRAEDLGKVFWYAGGIMDWNNVIGKHRGVDDVDTGQYDKIEKTDFASGCCFLTSREVLEKVGMFDEKFFLYYEESDLCERVKRNGFSIFYTPKSVLWHKNAQSTGGSGSDLQDYYISRNRLLFGMKHAPFRSKIALFRESLKLLIMGRKWQKIGIRDFYILKFGKGSFSLD
ncbi:MAG: glycosyltransferase family 2 protein [Candidatus Levybacteria bacterium CG_4_10_14_0_2_um_filter_36_16]|nr:MAG: hypothetical protein AUK12_00490 [Candidatus Levybacteria bacterium CG2_30_37_29]PIR79266.1 MAG: glycosyltransferase family 2 protein [Candidatus Levybacteria bacterium CG10_big_fil_rev_8_21_14_0_10_36_30]PIZ96576.1 MAG: glycosyltransferase family 2 protein [Candidatus Levybacteria bacterium CG_4_10_14_0_2_um_filter_36_16]PJA90339.1 MAG: glycosyltransferase family 2 protein [Candidatus Levybacteria bacterium CG_4_9_14_3_um_filter_36_7]